MIIIKFITHHLRSLFYGLVMGLGIVFLQEIALVSTFNIFLIAVLVLAWVLVLELYTDYYLASRYLKQLDLPELTMYSRTTQLIYHALLPLLQYVSLIAFIYTNNQPKLVLIYFIFSFFLYSLLFINIRAYNLDKFKLEESTHFIYDLIKICLFFLLTAGIINLTNLFGFSFYVAGGLISCSSAMLTFLVLLRRKHITYYNLLHIILAGIAIGYLSSSLLQLLGTKSLLIAFYTTLVFYIFNAILQHYIERTLKLSVMVEYILVSAICLLLIFLLP